VAVVLSWNVAGRVRSVAAQAAALAQRPADVVALQEVRASALDAWQDALAGLGLVHQHYSAPPAGGTAERRLGVLLAARAPLAPLPAPAGLPWPERYAAARVDLGGAVELHALHAPISAKAERVKVLTLEAVAAHLASPPHPAAPAVLVGDFNTPAYESREGEVRSFARTRTGALRAGYDARHDAAELGVVPGLARAGGWIDAFRAVHGYGARDRSWMYANGTFGYRLDHVLVRALAVEACAYEHGWREAGLSDHSALWAAVRFPD
jgi:endonuclease/exonuclease/phosphatase family metal-dependent hydrolase